MHVGPVHLMCEDHRREAVTKCRAEGAPATRHLSDGFVAPQSEAQRSGGDAGDEPVAVRPFQELETWDRRIARRDFGERERRGEGRTMLRPDVMFGAQSALRVLS